MDVGIPFIEPAGALGGDANVVGEAGVGRAGLGLW